MSTSLNQAELFACELASPVGRLGLLASDRGIREVLWLRRRALPSHAAAVDHPHLRRARRALAGFFECGQMDPGSVPLDLRELQGFRMRVSETLRSRVPAGEVVTYGELACLSGSPGAARAVGSVMSKNPIPLFIPCHRVVAQAGLGGFGPGLEAKRILLRLEGAEIRN